MSPPRLEQGENHPVPEEVGHDTRPETLPHPFRTAEERSPTPVGFFGHQGFRPELPLSLDVYDRGTRDLGTEVPLTLETPGGMKDVTSIPWRRSRGMVGSPGTDEGDGFESPKSLGGSPGPGRTQDG